MVVATDDSERASRSRSGPHRPTRCGNTASRPARGPLSAAPSQGLPATRSPAGTTASMLPTKACSVGVSIESGRYHVATTRAVSALPGASVTRATTATTAPVSAVTVAG